MDQLVHRGFGHLQPGGGGEWDPRRRAEGGDEGGGGAAQDTVHIYRGGLVLLPCTAAGRARGAAKCGGGGDVTGAGQHAGWRRVRSQQVLHRQLQPLCLG